MDGYFGIPQPVNTLNPESRHQFALKSLRILSFKWGEPRIPKTFWRPSTAVACDQAFWLEVGEKIPFHY